MMAGPSAEQNRHCSAINNPHELSCKLGVGRVAIKAARNGPAQALDSPKAVI